MREAIIMWGKSHRLSTKKAYALYNGLFNNVVDLETDPTANYLTEECVNTDNMRDLELIDVEGTTIGGGRDNPHKDEWDAIDDKAHYSEGGKKFTAFNHFIDIKKGPGLFDDYDGYSYKEGSASTDEYQSASDANEVEGVETFLPRFWRESQDIKWMKA